MTRRRAEVHTQMLIMERAGRVHGVGNLTVRALSRATLSVRCASWWR